MSSLTPYADAAEQAIAEMRAKLDAQVPLDDAPNRVSVRVMTAVMAAVIRAMADEADMGVDPEIIRHAFVSALASSIASIAGSLTDDRQPHMFNLAMNMTIQISRGALAQCAAESWPEGNHVSVPIRAGSA